jgi:hypothetical protein
MTREQKRGITVIVCGGRDYWNRSAVDGALDAIHAERTIRRLVEGGAAGADLLAAQWRHTNAVDGKSYRANWSLYGSSAGPRRNREMLQRETVDLVVAFPGNFGTDDMVRQARQAGVEVYEAGVAASDAPSSGGG